MISTTDITIPIGRNLNPPVFSSNLYTKQVSEDYPLGTSIVQVSATDLDGDLVDFSIVNDTNGRSALQIFFISPSTGTLVAIKPLAQTTGSSFTVRSCPHLLFIHLFTVYSFYFIF